MIFDICFDKTIHCALSLLLLGWPSDRATQTQAKWKTKNENDVNAKFDQVRIQILRQLSVKQKKKELNDVK